MIRKILEKVFITKKCTQRKTLHNLKTDIFELSDNTNIAKLFSSYQKQPPRGVHRKRCPENMQKIYRRTPMPKCNFNKVALQHPSPSLSNFPLVNLNPSSTQHPLCSLSVSLFFFLPHSTSPKVLDIPNHMPSQAIQIMIPYESNTLPIKKLTLWEPLLFQSYTTRSITTLCSIQSVLSSQENGWCFFIFTTLLAHTTFPITSTQNPFSHFNYFSPRYSALSCS